MQVASDILRIEERGQISNTRKFEDKGGTYILDIAEAES